MGSEAIERLSMGKGAPTCRGFLFFFKKIGDNHFNYNTKKMTITYKSDVMPATEVIVDLYNSAGLNRPTTDYRRISQMYVNSNLIVTAWDEDELVGISRSLTDFSYCCYLSDLAVMEGYKCKGIGRRMIELTKEVLGGQTMLLLLAAPSAMEYYPKVGLEKVANGFIIKRTS